MVNRLSSDANQCPCIEEVIGSNPISPTIASVHEEDLGLRELLEMSLGPEMKRKFPLRNLPDDQLLEL